MEMELMETCRSYTMSSSTYQSPFKPTPTSTQLDVFVRWLRLKKYRIEVTYGVYVYTPYEKIAFWTLFSFFFVVISSALLVYAYRSMAFLLDSAASFVVESINDERHRLTTSGGSLTSHLLLTAKHAATRLITTSAQTGGVEKAMMELTGGAARNSQVA
ncbi:hypothetical protein F4777DRAFT_573289 [Nemania sp. FL0916]|nr:hypothetical protein F4777DRAFT_573289 [Nemania sp. FL0916]